MKEHNFVAVKHERTLPGFQMWRCNDCETEVMFPTVCDQRYVNRRMANKLACLEPIGIKPN